MISVQILDRDRAGSRRRSAGTTSPRLHGGARTL